MTFTLERECLVNHFVVKLLFQMCCDLFFYFYSD